MTNINTFEYTQRTLNQMSKINIFPPVAAHKPWNKKNQVMSLYYKKIIKCEYTSIKWPILNKEVCLVSGGGEGFGEEKMK